MKQLLQALPPSLVQYLKFGLVGGLATLTHSALFVVLVEAKIVPPLPANLVAFLCALSVSYIGNRNWTFTSAPPDPGSAARFFVVSLIGLGLNSFFIALVTDALGLSYLYSLPFMVGVVPIVVFLLNKYWVFRS